MNRVLSSITTRAALRAGLGPIFIILMCTCLGGCELAGFVAQGVAPQSPQLHVKAEYHGLENQTVAVVVDANQALLFEHPLATREVCEAVTAKLAANVPGIRVRQARQIIDFQNRNIYWNTVTYSQLAKRLGVTRLVLIELTDYRMHEPGNVNIWRGVISGNVAVAEADGPTPDNLVYDAAVTIAYPPDKPTGVLNAEQRSFRLAMLDLFALAAAGRFFDHDEPRSESR